MATLSPAFAAQAFHRFDTVAGFLIGAFGAGAVVAAFLIGEHPSGRLGAGIRTAALLMALPAFLVAACVLVALRSPAVAAERAD